MRKLIKNLLKSAQICSNLLKSYLIFLLFILFILSCQEKVSLDPTTKTLKGKSYWVEGGIIHFESIAAMENLTDSISKMQNEQRKKWERYMRFTSFASAQDSTIRLLDEACNETEFWQIVYNNPQFLRPLNGNIEHTPLSPSLRYIANKEGIFCINSIYHKISEKKITITKAVSINEAKENFMKNKAVTTYYIRANAFPIPDKKSEGCGTDLIKASKRTGNREVNVTLKIEIIPKVESSCCVVYQQVVTIEIVGKKTNMWGQFYTYATTHSYNDLEIIFDRLDEVYAPYQCRNINGCPSLCDATGFLHTKLNFPAYTGPEQTVLTYTLFTSKKIYNTPIPITTLFKSAKVKAWTRGTTHENYAAICCNYEYCGF